MLSDDSSTAPSILSIKHNIKGKDYDSLCNLKMDKLPELQQPRRRGRPSNSNKNRQCGDGPYSKCLIEVQINSNLNSIIGSKASIFRKNVIYSQIYIFSTYSQNLYKTNNLIEIFIIESILIITILIIMIITTIITIIIIIIIIKKITK